MLVALVVGALGLLVFLAGRYEASVVQSQLERDATDALVDIRAALTRNVQSLQALQSAAATPGPEWQGEAQALLRERRELMRIEWRDVELRSMAAADTPYRPPVYALLGRDAALSETMQACASAKRLSGPAYSSSYFVPRSDGLGHEILELCLPLVSAGQLTGYLVASYALQDILGELVGPALKRSQEVSFTEPDGTRLALHGVPRRGGRGFTAQQLLDLPGNTLVLRMDSWQAAPTLFPNVLTAMVLTLALALATVLFMLARDSRRRLRAEHDLAEALAFRKAMEDSLVTGLRARDLEGRIRYVNPAFCAMVGFTAEELLGRGTPAPYWPPEHVDEYQQRQAVRLAGHLPPREGFESVFMRKDGTRFPVLIIEAPLINAQQLQTGWMSAFLDISEQRQVEELQRASHERLQATARLATVGEMASLLSHEINQPLAAISSYATGSLNLMEAHATGAQAGRSVVLLHDLRTALQRIAEQAERAGRVIRSVHDFVRRRDQSRSPTAPAALVQAVLPLVSLQARKLGVRVEVSCRPDLPAVACDHTMVEQVLLNLARNAMQAMDDPAIRERTLTLAVRRTASNAQRGWLEFEVRDTGLGIPASVEPRLFTPFFTTKAEGMGLGLSLCRTVIEQHAGELHHRAAEPQGTVFCFTLPIASEGDPA